MHTNIQFLILIFLGLSATQAHAQLSGLLGVLQYLGLHGNSNGSLSLGNTSRGQCEYSFGAYALMRERHMCVPDDEHILHLAEVPQQRRPPIMLKCLEPDRVEENGTYTLDRLLIMKSAKEIVTLLKPIGNATKRHEPGSCVVIHFCIPTSLECARVGKLINLLPHLFPTLPIAYIDAHEFTRFNAEFGIVSVPTLMIFHQGRPMIKYDPARSEKTSVRSFILRHTNIKKTVHPKDIHPIVLEWVALAPLSPVVAKKTDIYLGLSWAFILVCLANYMRRTPFWKLVMEMVQRNWRESEETQMEMVD